MIGATGQVRSLLRDVSNRDLFLQIGQGAGGRSFAAYRSRATDRTLLGMGAAALWLLSRRKYK